MQILAFAAALESRKITASVRQTRGLDASAACGQLRNKFQKSSLPAETDGQESQPDAEAVACWCPGLDKSPVLPVNGSVQLCFDEETWLNDEKWKLPLWLISATENEEIEARLRSDDFDDSFIGLVTYVMYTLRSVTQIMMLTYQIIKF